MKIWILGEREPEPYDPMRERTKDNPWYLKYDMAYGFIVCAENEAQARLLASDDAGDEGEDTWLNPKWSYCKELECTEPMVVLRDFLSG